MTPRLTQPPDGDCSTPLTVDIDDGLKQHYDTGYVSTPILGLGLSLALNLGSSCLGLHAGITGVYHCTRLDTPCFA